MDKSKLVGCENMQCKYGFKKVAFGSERLLATASGTALLACSLLMQK